MSKSPKSNLIGKKFNFLTPVEYLGKGNGIWLCVCDCGNYTMAKMNSLKTGKKKSCGCYKEKQNKQKRKNNIFVKDNRGAVVGFDECRKSFCFDDIDLEKINSYYWSVGYNGYVNTNINNEKISLHRFIMGAKSNDTIDHINRNPTDNRRKNLRFCTDHQNTCNKNIAINNKSGKTGICKEGEKWHAYIFFNGKTHHLGRFTNFKDALGARIKAEKELFGEFSSSFNS